MNLRLVIVSCLLLVQIVYSEDVFNVFDKIFDKCQMKESTFKCLKVHAVKAVQRALQSKSFGLTDGLNVVRVDQINESSRSFPDRLLKEEQLEKLNSTQIDELLYDTSARFLETHRIQLNVPKLLDEGRGKKGSKKGGYGGAFLAALAIKGFFMSMAYKGIAIMAGAAILIGKMALLLAALLGLKKLVSTDHESTTFEIVKHPVYSHSHSHSSSHGDSDDHYYRNIDSHEEMVMQDKLYNNNNKAFNKAYRAHVPQN